jgi:predicted nucleic acid-binding protein
MTVAVLDACILYSPALRDLFMHLTEQDVFQPKWTETIHDEWMRNVLANRPDLVPANIERTRRMMNQHGRRWKCPDYEALIPTLTLPDPDDRHVLAAAVAGGASHIITFNLSDFPASMLAPHGIIAVHPDPFLVDLLAQKPEPFLEAMRQLLASLRNPPRTFEQQLEIMRDQGLRQTAQRLTAQNISP